VAEANRTPRLEPRKEFLAYLVWFVLIFVAGIWLSVKHDRIQRDLRGWSSVTDTLQRAIVAVRQGAQAGCLDEQGFQRVLLEHGIKAWTVPKRERRQGEGDLQLRFAAADNQVGKLSISMPRSGAWIATAAATYGEDDLQIKALLFPMKG